MQTPGESSARSAIEEGHRKREVMTVYQTRSRATTLKLRRAKLDVYLVVDSLLAMGLPFGLPFSRPFNFDESIGRPLISAAMAKRWHGKSKVFGV